MACRAFGRQCESENFFSAAIQIVYGLVCNDNLQRAVGLGKAR